MQARRGGRDSALGGGEQGLVVGLILRQRPTRAVDIWRQGKRAGLTQALIERSPFLIEAQPQAAALGRGAQRGRERRRKIDAVACAQAAGVAAERGRSSVTPMLAAPRRPVSCAGITLVSLAISRSPGRSRRGRSATDRSCRAAP
jgi:hypothetical protein